MERLGSAFLSLRVFHVHLGVGAVRRGFRVADVDRRPMSESTEPSAERHSITLSGRQL